MAELSILPEQASVVNPTRIRGFWGVICSLCLHAILVGAGLAFWGGTKSPQVSAHHIALVDAPHLGRAATQESVSAVEAASGVELATEVRREPEVRGRVLPAASEVVRSSIEEKSVPVSAKKRKKDPMPSAPKAVRTSNEDRNPASFAGGETGRAGENASAAPPSLYPQGDVAGDVSSPQTISAGGVTAYQSGVVDSPPSVTRRVAPQYPLNAKRKRIQGAVVVQIVVDTSGLPHQCTVVSAKPEGYFEDASLEAARRLRFKPGKIKGVVVNTVVLLPFDFQLR